MNKLPKLTMNGFDAEICFAKEYAQRGKKDEEINEEDLAPIESFINLYFEKQKKINLETSSYGLKHIIEDHLGFYVSNGQCIKAFINCGFKVKPVRINAYFNVSKKDVALVTAKRRTGMNV